MRNTLRAVAVIAGLVCVPALTAFVATRGNGDEDETASATAGGVMPLVIMTPPANMVGATPWANPAPWATATATATSTPRPLALTPEERTEAEALLAAAALRPEDIPEEFPLEYEGFTTNEEAAEAREVRIEMFGSADGAGPDPYAMGRILGYRANYGTEAPDDLSTFSGTASLGVSLELFHDSGGAHAYLEAARQVLSDPEGLITSQRDAYESFGVEVNDLAVSQILVADLGEERVALQVKVVFRTPHLDTDLDAVEETVAVRRDRLVGSVTMVTVNASPDEEQLEALARKLDERTKDALE